MAFSNQQMKPDPVNSVDTKHTPREFKVRYYFAQEKEDHITFNLKKDGLFSKAYFEVWWKDVRRILDVSKDIPNEILELFEVGEPKKSRGYYKVTFTLKRSASHINTRIMDQYFLPRTPSPVDRKDVPENQGSS